MHCLKLAYFTSSRDFLVGSAEPVPTSGLRILNFLLFQASEEEEIVDLMLTKIFSFLGIKCKKEEKPVTNDQLKQPVSK